MNSEYENLVKVIDENLIEAYRLRTSTIVGPVSDLINIVNVHSVTKDTSSYLNFPGFVDSKAIDVDIPKDEKLVFPDTNVYFLVDTSSKVVFSKYKDLGTRGLLNVSAFAISSEEKTEDVGVPDTNVYFMADASAKIIFSKYKDLGTRGPLNTSAFAISTTNKKIEDIEVPVTKITEAEARIIKSASVTYASAIIITRLNSNVYKNIFPEDVFDLEYIEKLKENTPMSYNEINQKKHGFQVNDVVAYDSVKGYFKPVASSETQGIVGIVSSIRNENVFSLMKEGRLSYPNLAFTDTTTLYLSDKIPGKLVHHTDIVNTAYIPIATYTDRSIIINILDGTFGTPLTPYDQPDDSANFEHYTTAELQEVISAVMGG